MPSLPGLKDLFSFDPFDFFGGRAGAKAAKRASNAQRQGFDAALEQSERFYDENVERMAPFLERAMGIMREGDQGLSTQGLDSRLGDIFQSDAFSALKDQRMKSMEHQLNQAGMRRSDMALKEMAALPTDLGFQLENMLFGRQQNVIGSGQNAAGGLGAMGANAAANQGNIAIGRGDAIAQGIVGAQQARNAGMTNAMNTAMTAGAFFFSDERLKKNIRKIGQIKDLNLYEWDWVDGVTPITGKMSVGFIAQEVKDKYPEFIREIHGFNAVDYQGLTNHLRAAA